MLTNASMRHPVRLTVLSDMAGPTAEQQAAQAKAWGLTSLDVKGVGGKNIADLTEAEADALASAYTRHGVAVEAFSTHLFNLAVEDGPAAFEAHLKAIDRVLDLARHLRPRVIRLLAASTRRRAEINNSADYLLSQQPWLIPLYGQAVDRIHAAGFHTVIENEIGPSIFTTAQEMADFFTALGRREKVACTWDVQNLWQQGVFPSLVVYQTLRPHLGYLHLKGGIAGDDGRTLKWRSTLESASWPVLDITRAVLADGVRPAICLNPSHGEPHPQHPMAGAVERDLAYLRQAFAGKLT
jgi:hypothetical protein